MSSCDVPTICCKGPYSQWKVLTGSLLLKNLQHNIWWPTRQIISELATVPYHVFIFHLRPHSLEARSFRGSTTPTAKLPYVFRQHLEQISACWTLYVQPQSLKPMPKYSLYWNCCKDQILHWLILACCRWLIEALVCCSWLVEHTS